ncbi:MAG: terminase small subunit [Burkholderiales bacterium]|nr:terminase small subunit [Burkholderiales bacterium]
MNSRQKKFCEEYLVDLNATQAAKRAGYTGKTVRTQASKMLTNPNIEKYIQELMKKREERTEVTQDRVLKEWAKLAFLDPQKFFDESGNLLPVNKLDKDVAAALVGIDVTENVVNGELVSVTKKIKFADKKGALDSCARHLGMFNDKVQHEGNFNMNFTVEFVRPDHGGEDSTS